MEGWGAGAGKSQGHPGIWLKEQTEVPLAHSGGWAGGFRSERSSVCEGPTCGSWPGTGEPGEGGHRQAQEGALWEREEPVRQGSRRGQGGVRGARGGQGNKGPGRDTPSQVTVTEDGRGGSTCSARPGRRRRGAQPSWGRGVEEAGRATVCQWKGINREELRTPGEKS